LNQEKKITRENTEPRKKKQNIVNTALRRKGTVIHTVRLFGTNSLEKGAMWHATEDGISESERPSIARQRLCNQVSCIIVWVTKHVQTTMHI
jgi:hypothetical protein